MVPLRLTMSLKILAYSHQDDHPPSTDLHVSKLLAILVVVVEQVLTVLAQRGPYVEHVVAVDEYLAEHHQVVVDVFAVFALWYV